MNGVHYSVRVTPERNPTRHDRDSVASAALALLDDVGLADLSMRRIAARLDIQPSALYWHFASKQELFAELADRITSPIAAAPDSDVLTTARRVRDALLAHRDGAELVLSTYALRLGSSGAHGAFVRALGDREDASLRATALLHFTLGHTVLIQQRMHADSHGAARADDLDDTTRGLDQVFDLGVRALASAVTTTTPPHDRV